MLFDREYKYILTCDLETNGLNPFDQWLTGSFGLLDFKTLKTIKELEVESRPSSYNEDAYEIHFIREDLAMSFQDREKAISQIIEFIPDNVEDFVFLCHANTNNFGSYYHFDFACLKADFELTLCHSNMFEQYFKHVYSTHTIARQLRKEKLIPKKMKLGLKELYLHFYGEDFNHHEAKADRLAMEKLLRTFNGLQDNQLNFI